MARNNDSLDPRDHGANRLEQSSSVPNDLPDSREDREKLRNEETTIDLPDVKDIPGQEFVNAPPLGALGDTTIASDDEEGRRVFDEEEEESRSRTGADFDVSREERATLEQTEYLPTNDENNLARARMDNTDFEGDPLNERSFGEEVSGDDIDVPGNYDETDSDAMGQGDEENKLYSMGSADNDNMNEGTP